MYMNIYVVKSGDTVYSIANRFGVSAERIISDNAIIDPSKLAVGQAILILFPETVHTVKAGDTFAGIAQQYGIPVIKLFQNNPTLTNEPYLPPGRELTIFYDVHPAKNIMVSGFAYDFIDPAVYESALPYMTYTIHFGYGFDENGDLITIDDNHLITLAHAYRTAVLLSLGTINRDGTFGSSKVDRLLTDSDFQNKVLDSMINEIAARGAQGMDIDMEYIPPQYRLQFSAFVQNAAEKLTELGYVLNVDLAPKTSAGQPGLLYEAHDYKLLGSYADYVFLMTYEWGYTYGPPMAIAPINNVRQVLEYALTEIPADKIFLGIPNYAYDWKLPFERGVTAAVTINNLGAVNRAVFYNAEIQFDEKSKSPFYYYTDPSDNSEHVVWFEDVRSMEAKYNLVSEKNIRGCGYWNLMYPFPQNYLLLNSMFNIIKIWGNTVP